jgi:hypothetical protein
MLMQFFCIFLALKGMLVWKQTKEVKLSSDKEVFSKTNNLTHPIRPNTNIGGEKSGRK